MVRYECIDYLLLIGMMMVMMMTMTMMMMMLMINDSITRDHLVLR